MNSMALFVTNYSNIQIILIIHPNTDLGGYLQHWDVMGAKLINITVLQ